MNTHSKQVGRSTLFFSNQKKPAGGAAVERATQSKQPALLASREFEPKHVSEGYSEAVQTRNSERLALSLAKGEEAELTEPMGESAATGPADS